MRGFFADFLYFSRTERRGILLLSVICLILLCLLWQMPKWFQEEPYDFSAFKAEMAALNQGTNHTNSSSSLSNNKQTATTPLVESNIIKLFPFNPNTISAEQLTNFGLPKSTIRSWMNYRSKGGYFKNADDLAGFRALSQVDYDRLASYLQFAEEKLEAPSDSPRSKRDQEKKPPLKIDINKADQTAWQSLYGIGPKLSTRIIKFRDALGGFSHVEQVGETYGLPDSTIQHILPQLVLSPILEQLAINELGKKELAKHPYIDYKTAGLIIAYRKQHGHFQNIDDLANIKVLDKQLLNRLGPYLQF